MAPRFLLQSSREATQHMHSSSHGSDCAECPLHFNFVQGSQLWQCCIQLEFAEFCLQGAGFWEWFAPGQIAPASEGYGQGLYGIYETDEAFQ